MLMTGVSPTDLEKLLERGWRRVRPGYFRPAGGGCEECVSLRVPAARFSPASNVKRAGGRTAPLGVRGGARVVDGPRLPLYRRWHADREAERGWKRDSIGAESYAMQFCFPHASAREFT